MQQIFEINYPSFLTFKKDRKLHKAFRSSKIKKFDDIFLGLPTFTLLTGVAKHKIIPFQFNLKNKGFLHFLNCIHIYVNNNYYYYILYI